ncbi:hypothetical protein [Blastococcus aurantiacus]|uniref:hypothetical protein n=1 Tax=Blastococcus aurantiacus TaxID=1550231 RepID=UPI001C40B977|nr:hypothetical protein [Blastococcus aurantiacus]
MRAALDELFPGPDLDRDVWFPYYLPHWSTRAESAATWSVHAGELHLTIPPEQPLWCPDTHGEPLRVSCVQTGSFSGPVGSAVGQQPFADGLVVREEQPEFRGWTPEYGRGQVRMRAVLDDASMVAFWMSGVEDRPGARARSAWRRSSGTPCGRARRRSAWASRPSATRC